jgi:hypothetical protein
VTSGHIVIAVGYVKHVGSALQETALITPLTGMDPIAYWCIAQTIS